MVITGACGTVTSNPATLTVNALPNCALQTNTTVRILLHHLLLQRYDLLSMGRGRFYSYYNLQEISVQGTYNVTITNASGCTSGCSRTLTVIHHQHQYSHYTDICSGTAITQIDITNPNSVPTTPVGQNQYCKSYRYSSKWNWSSIRYGHLLTQYKQQHLLLPTAGAVHLQLLLQQ